MTKIKVNDVWLIKELDNKEGVSNAYNYFLSQGICILASKACLLNFWKCIKSRNLENPFSKEKPFMALSSLCEDKALESDGLCLAF